MRAELETNGFTEQQVQAIYLKSSTSFPQCDIGVTTVACNPNYQPPAPGLARVDAYQSEQYLGNILRYLKCCKLSDGTARYPHLHQVFVTTRIYGGYAANADGSHGGSNAGCLSPEPYSYESAFAVQRLIVAQIDQDADVENHDPYAQTVLYKSDGTGNTPWFDWGPYIWADADNPRPDNLFWCDSSSTSQRCREQFSPDLRFGDMDQPNFYWGDHTHPTAFAAGKVAGQIITWLGQQPGHRNPWTPWLDAPQ